MNQRRYFSIEEVRKNIFKSILLIFIVVGLIIGLSYFLGYLIDDPKSGLYIGLFISVIVVPFQLLISRWTILLMTKGRKVNPNNLREVRVQHLVEGLSISAGLRKVPDVYIVPSNVPNAFASGLSEKTAFIGVTRGLLDIMDDQELEGVIAHEISHIVHKDVLLQQLVVALVSVLLIIALIVQRVAIFGRHSRDDDSKGAGLIIVGIILLAILVRPFAYLIGNLIQLSISRKREYAADAYAVRITGYNQGLASALRKLGNYPPRTKEEIESLGGAQMRAMYINFPEKVNSLFSTHPPLKERINRVENMY